MRFKITKHNSFNGMLITVIYNIYALTSIQTTLVADDKTDPKGQFTPR